MSKVKTSRVKVCFRIASVQDSRKHKSLYSQYCLFPNKKIGWSNWKVNDVADCLYGLNSTKMTLNNKFIGLIFHFFHGIQDQKDMCAFGERICWIAYVDK